MSQRALVSVACRGSVRLLNDAPNAGRRARSADRSFKTIVPPPPAGSSRTAKRMDDAEEGVGCIEWIPCRRRQRRDGARDAICVI